MPTGVGSAQINNLSKGQSIGVPSAAPRRWQHSYQATAKSDKYKNEETTRELWQKLSATRPRLPRVEGVKRGASLTLATSLHPLFRTYLRPEPNQFDPHRDNLIGQQSFRIRT